MKLAQFLTVVAFLFGTSASHPFATADVGVGSKPAVMTDDPSAAGGRFGAADIVTKKSYRDFRLHVELLIMNSGGNSGVYLQNRHEIQVLDGDRTSHGMGAIINESESPYYAYNGLGRWNSYDVVFRAARFENGNDLAGWNGDPSRWSAVHGMIRGANDDQVPSSTYLFTAKEYRNFRLLLEVRQTVSDKHSTMHSAVAALGETFVDTDDNKFGFRGPLLMFCHDWGIWDAHRRNRVVPASDGLQVENKGEWNQIEILANGGRIRFAANGREIFDYTDKPDMLQASPIGLQLHSNDRPQEYHFRSLILTENPGPLLVTVSEK
ncbi:MAG: DUF1080 domain-containing protein [Pirellulaceae bacterium]|nr:DUF1080 domain-containing protein [Pirellulaceae bacterium]